MTWIISFGFIAIVVGFITATPQHRELDGDNSIAISLTLQPRLVEVGKYYDPAIGILKRYYTDGIPRDWVQNKDFCLSLGMQAVSPLSDAETVYITTQSSASCTYYWTSGRQRHNWTWELYTGIPIYESPNWCELPSDPQCIVLHRWDNLHPYDCTKAECTLCQEIISTSVTSATPTFSTVATTNLPSLRRKSDKRQIYPIILIALVSLIALVLLYLCCSHQVRRILRRRKEAKEQLQIINNCYLRNAPDRYPTQAHLKQYYRNGYPITTQYLPRVYGLGSHY